MVMGAIPSWDQGDAMTTLKANPGRVSVASPWSYEVAPDGSVRLQPPLTVESERELTRELRRLDLRIVPSIANTQDGSWNEAVISRVLADPDRRARHVRAVTALVSSNDFDGIQVDYENLGAAQRDDFTATMADLARALHADRRTLWITLHPKENDAGYDARNTSQDFAELGRIADRVMLMAYDWHWETGPSGPIAPYGWVDRVVRYTVSQVPPQKVVLGLGLFGYDWGGESTLSLTWGQIVERADQRSADEQWDVASQSPHLTYTQDGLTHQVWYENARSIDLKISVAKRYRLGGVALWRLGREDPAIWRLPTEMNQQGS